MYIYECINRRNGARSWYRGDFPLSPDPRATARCSALRIGYRKQTRKQTRSVNLRTLRGMRLSREAREERTLSVRLVPRMALEVPPGRRDAESSRTKLRIDLLDRRRHPGPTIGRCPPATFLNWTRRPGLSAP